MINTIHIVGASGSGTTTLAQNLEHEYGYKWLDTDDYFWAPAHLPFTVSRPVEERISLLKADMNKNIKQVIAGSLCGWGDVFISAFDLVIFIYTPADIRAERLKKREYQRYGERIREGGDMYEEHIDFIKWAQTYDTLEPPERCLKLHEKWLEGLTCPVLRLDGTKTVKELLKQVAIFII